MKHSKHSQGSTELEEQLDLGAGNVMQGLARLRYTCEEDCCSTLEPVVPEPGAAADEGANAGKRQAIYNL